MHQHALVNRFFGMSQCQRALRSQQAHVERRLPKSLWGYVGLKLYDGRRPSFEQDELMFRGGNLALYLTEATQQC